MTEQTHKQGMRPIWYFVGWLLLLIGLLVIVAGITNLFTSLPGTSVIGYVHPNLWWGAFIALVGGFYVWKYTGVTEK